MEKVIHISPLKQGANTHVCNMDIYDYNSKKNPKPMSKHPNKLYHRGKVLYLEQVFGFEDFNAIILLKVTCCGFV